ncbi:MAG: dihydrodipicolinate synthase family protein [Planctomycetes bacterium]|nr:dihydrodipicolinate synthase family protein [Planctomycetota bacterium]MCB9918782.1 dihydrodipicolinate synthase family protein [Planctomycetota bacterium]
MKHTPLSGLVAATYTPLGSDGRLATSRVPDIVERLLEDGVRGLYVCGSTGEGMSLSCDERMQVTEAYVAAVRRRVPVIVQVGHNSIEAARRLAAHAQSLSVAAISATCPSYYPITSTRVLVECMADIASAAPETPFYYYHIPVLTHVGLDMPSFLHEASLDGGRQAIDTLVGLKFSAPQLHEFQACLELADRRFDIVWGTDEMLLGALATGARAAIGSTYNIAAPLYLGLIDAFESGDMPRARAAQSRSVAMVRAIARFPFHSAMKEVLRMQGLDLGACRAPLRWLSPSEIDELRAGLDAIGFFEWSRGAR